MEREQGRGGKRKLEAADVSPEERERTCVELARAVLRGLDEGVNLRFLKVIAGQCLSYSRLGRAMVWTMFRMPSLIDRSEISHALARVLAGRTMGSDAMHRDQPSGRSLFPLPLKDFEGLHELALRKSLEAFVESDELGEDEDVDAWTCLCVMGLNGIAGKSRAARFDTPRKAQRQALLTVRSSIKTVLDLQVRLNRTVKEAEKELSGRFLTYTGEEVPKMQVLTVAQVVAALPPSSHAGSIDALQFCCDGTKSFLSFPEQSLLFEPPPNVKLQAKVHIEKGQELELAKTLVERNICTWVAEEDVLCVKGFRVLNGMFGVGKGTFLPQGGEVLRLIMNLIPSNSVLRQSEGGTSDLPGITQFLSTVLHGKEELEFYQSDMSSAFYLFKIPGPWSRMMAFNLSFPGNQVGFGTAQRFYLACCVIPMGWSSAVSIMQEIAERLTSIAKLPSTHQVRRTAPLPPWIVGVLDASTREQRAWYHVYLDNFCAMEKIAKPTRGEQGDFFHRSIETAWESSGVLSSAKKKVVRSSEVQELGAHIHGEKGTLGPTPERLLKLVQITLAVIGQVRLKVKWIQVVVGRWVHIMSFRRPGMVIFDKVWHFISKGTTNMSIDLNVRSELLACCLCGLLMFTDLRAKISGVTTASDASSTGGAVGMSRKLIISGEEFAAQDRKAEQQAKVIPIMVLSLFNGVGGCFRLYDLCGVRPKVGVSYETNKNANRVTSRRWPYVTIEKDVRDLDEAKVREWRYRHPELVELHVWAGFPCIDLSAVKANRLNLEGPGSRLFWEFVRILKLIRRIFGYSFRVVFFGENVSSMDAEAEQEISKALGCKPYMVDSSDVVPIHRPRFCWTNVPLTYLEGVWMEDERRWTRVHFEHEYPEMDQWLTEGTVWPGGEGGDCLPTCMKAIPRTRPPEKPAGLQKTDEDTRLRWRADRFRFPPYQYSERFIVWRGEKWRLIDSSEREILHGLGYGHTELCMSAGDIKRDPQAYEDMRKSLVGDGFNCFTFVFFAAMACARWVSIPSYHRLWSRMGMAPGFSCDIAVEIPLTRRLAYGSVTEKMQIQNLHESLLRRTNHTGSDVRISTGMVLNPKAFPRQSASSGWWQWNKVFACRWKRSDHINSLELRSIIHSVDWRIFHLQEFGFRIFHLSDSYICLSIISKGRSSSRMLRPLMQRLSATLLACNLHLVVAHVESTENPTDHDSRS